MAAPRVRSPEARPRVRSRGPAAKDSYDHRGRREKRPDGRPAPAPVQRDTRCRRRRRDRRVWSRWRAAVPAERAAYRARDAPRAPAPRQAAPPARPQSATARRAKGLGYTRCSRSLRRFPHMPIRSVVLVATMIVASIPGASVAFAQEAPTRRPDVIYVPTPEAVVEAMLQVANVGKNDIVYDLGCGDGRIPVTAAKKYGATGVGIDIDPQRIKEAKENVAKNNVGDKVTIVQGDLFEQDLSKATV